MVSFNATVDRYRALLANADISQSKSPKLQNENFDIGGPNIAGRYQGTDEAYAKLVGKLADRQFAGISPDLRRNILAYYNNGPPPVPARSSSKEKAQAAKLPDQLTRLKALGE